MHDDTLSAAPARLASWLSDRNMRQREFAALVGISEPYLSRLLSGKKRPSLEVASKIAEATGGAVEVGGWTGAPAAGSGRAA